MLLGHGNIAGRYVGHGDAVSLQQRKDPLHVAPPVTELLLLVGSPFDEHLLRIVGSLIQVGARKVQDKRPSHYFHFNHPELVVVSQQLWDVAATDFTYPMEQKMAHSAEVQMHLSVSGHCLSIGHLGPNYVILDNPIDHPPSAAEIFLSVDGNETRWAVTLVDGLSASQARSRISLSG